MGGHMANNLLKAGHAVAVYDREAPPATPSRGSQSRLGSHRALSCTERIGCAHHGSHSRPSSAALVRA